MTDPAPVPSPAPEPPADTGPTGAAEEWQRLHPLSPVLRGGLFVLGVVGYVISQVLSEIFDLLDPEAGRPDEIISGGQGGGTEFALSHPLLGLVALVLVVAAVAGTAYVSWRFDRFRVTGGQVELRSGVLFRQHRQVPLERIQAVETTRPLLARLLGLAQVVVQSAGGSDSQLTLAFVDLERAEAVRTRLLDLAGRSDEREPAAAQTPAAGQGGATSDDGPPGQVAPRRAQGEESVVAVPNGRLFLATILHGSTIVLGIAAVAGLIGVGMAWSGGSALVSIPALVPVVLGLGISRVRELLVHGNFSLARTGTSLRVRHGLTDLRTASIPLHRVQAVEVLQPLWWRPLGWWRVRLNVAGVESGEAEGATGTVVLPVGSTHDALTVLETLGAAREDPLLVAALYGAGAGHGAAWVGPPRAARWLVPWSWRRIGYALGGHLVLIRTGRWTRRAVLVPQARVQSLSLEQGPIQRRLGLSSALIVSTPGPVSPVVPQLATRDAERFLAVVGDLARTARRPVPGGGPQPLAGASPLAPDGPPLVDWPPTASDEMKGWTS